MPNHSPWTTVTVIAALGLIIYTAGVSKAEPESVETEPLQVTLNAPVQGAVLVPDLVQLQASAFAAPGSSLTLTFQGRRAAPFPGPDITLVAIPGYAVLRLVEKWRHSAAFHGANRLDRPEQSSA